MTTGKFLVIEGPDGSGSSTQVALIKKYLEQTTPAEINIAKDKVVIIVLSQEPLAILIKNDEIARSFKEYFNIMWKIAKK